MPFLLQSMLLSVINFILNLENLTYLAYISLIQEVRFIFQTQSSLVFNEDLLFKTFGNAQPLTALQCWHKVPYTNTQRHIVLFTQWFKMLLLCQCHMMQTWGTLCSHACWGIICSADNGMFLLLSTDGSNPLSQMHQCIRTIDFLSCF